MFHLVNGELCAEAVPLANIAEHYGTPCYVYSRAALTSAYRAFAAACGSHQHLICYAMKANATLAVLEVFAGLGAGFDIVSGGELARAMAAGGDPRKVVFSGVGKGEEEMRQALSVGILCFNVESASELERLNRVAGSMQRVAPVSFRVNPDVDANTHPYISTGLKANKFGVPIAAAFELYQQAAAMPNIRVTGIDCHIGSQITETAPLAEAAEKMLALVDRLAAAGIVIEHFDFGGGLGIRYHDETPPPVEDYVKAMIAALGTRKLKALFEPGRVLTGNAGVLLTRIEYLKPGAEKNFLVVDAAMNDLLRPALYDAWHDIVPVHPREGAPAMYDVVGPVCESADFLARGRELAVAEGDLLAIKSAGAYAMAMSSNYNTRTRAAEVMVDGDKAHLVRRRETIAELISLERTLP
jgi:diaminopimelate decarboxylase